MNKPTETDLAGMTVNERLFTMGLLNEWDAATKERNRDLMIYILAQCTLSLKQCEQTTDAILKNPVTFEF